MFHFHDPKLSQTFAIICRPAIVRALQEFKISVYGENYDQEEANTAAAKASGSEASRKRKAMAETATRESAGYDWADLAENGKVRVCFLYYAVVLVSFQQATISVL